LSTEIASIGPYRITGRLDAGGMGVVYRGEDADTGPGSALLATHFNEASGTARRLTWR